ncbi:sigma-70 family RNA polymerase sigma factor [Fictibacillus aquaticus]|uniref:RNA polymerase n=1 Tax=Fictibacillus aquaticus TaxID=2021314 RepID=A0A235F5P2_9BACL|nr:sigma-70 family RNA polymerase sigma factor [Fictibacillus aquaticus]OYD56542.1 RNA polymerase [Fictibacillus aquaticus]
MEVIHLVQKAVRGNDEAFEALMKHESEKMYKTAFLYVRNKEDALDVVQETVCKAYTSIHQLREPAYFSTWLIKILIRNAYQLLSKQKKVVLTGDDFLNQAAEKGTDSYASELDVTCAISRLEKNYQTAIILFYYHDFSIRRIADTMEKPESTVKTYLRRARLELKNLLGGTDTYGKSVV